MESSTESPKETRDIKPKGGCNREKQSGVTIVVGKRGCGKTFLVENSLINMYPRNLIVSPLDDDYPRVQEFYDLPTLVDYMADHKIYRIKTPLMYSLDDLCRIVWYFGNLNFILEESNRMLPQKKELSDEIKDILLRGRHRNIDLILVSQRFAAININIRSQYTRIFAFNQSEKADVKALEEMAGAELPLLRDLQVGEYYEISPFTDLEVKKLAHSGIKR